MVCGLDHTLFVSHTGDLFSIGDDSLGQLGRASHPKGLDDDDRLVAATGCGTAHALEEWMVRDATEKPLSVLRVRSA